MKLPSNLTRDNTIIPNLSHIQHARLVWVNQYGQHLDYDSSFPTVRLAVVSPEELAYPHPLYPGESELQRAGRLGLLDVWTPVLYMKVSSSNYLVYSEERALSLWEEWKKRHKI